MNINLKEVYTFLMRAKRVYSSTDLHVKSLTNDQKKTLFLSMVLNANTPVFVSLQAVMRTLCS